MRAGSSRRWFGATSLRMGRLSSRWTRRAVVIIAVVGAGVAPTVAAASTVRAPTTPILNAAAISVSLDSYYPNTSRQASYLLDGQNVAQPSAPSRSVFWFTNLGGGTFRQYNWAPYQTCHFDQLQWVGGVLRYQITRDQCGTNNNETD